MSSRIWMAATGSLLGGAGLYWYASSRYVKPAFGWRSGSSHSAIPKNLVDRFHHYAKRDASGREFLDPIGLVACICLLDDDGKAMLSPKDPENGLESDLPLHVRERLDKLFLLLDTDHDRGIHYEEFCIFFTLLSTRRRYLKLAFRVFDKNEDNCLSRHEFRHLLNALMIDPAVRIVKNRPSSKATQNQSSVNSFQSSASADAVEPSEQLTGNTMLTKDSFLQSPFAKLFFGPNGDRRISFDEFWSLIGSIRWDVRAVEFGLYDPENTGKIKFEDFRRIVFRGLPKIDRSINEDESTRSSKNNRGNINAKDEYISWDFYLKIFDVFRENETIQEALQCAVRSKPPEDASGCSGSGEVDGTEFSRILEDNDIFNCFTQSDVDRIVRIFDADGSGKLSPSEFVRICQLRRSFFVERLPRFSELRRNTVQQFFFCMQQLE